MSAWSPRLAAALCLLSIAAQLGCSGNVGSPQNFDSPDACFTSLQQAGANGDVAGVVRCFTDESRDAMTGGLVMMGAMFKTMSGMASLGGPQAAAEAQKQLGVITAVMQQHGVTEQALKDAAAGLTGPRDPQAMAALGDVVKDKAAFIADMVAALEQAAANQPGAGPNFSEKFQEEFSGKLQDVNIDGERAVARVVGGSRDHDIKFQKTAAGWKLQFDMSQGQFNQNGAAPPTKMRR